MNKASLYEMAHSIESQTAAVHENYPANRIFLGVMALVGAGAALYGAVLAGAKVAEKLIIRQPVGQSDSPKVDYIAELMAGRLVEAYPGEGQIPDTSLCPGIEER